MLKTITATALVAAAIFAGSQPSATADVRDHCEMVDQTLAPLPDHGMLISTHYSTCIQVPRYATVVVDMNEVQPGVLDDIQLYLRAPDGSLYPLNTVGSDNRVYGMTDKLGAENMLLGSWKIYIRDTAPNGGGMDAFVQRTHLYFNEK